MIRAASYLLVILMMALYLGGCASGVKPIAPKMNAIDQTKGSYHKFQGNKLILLTMDNDAHQFLSEGQDIKNTESLPDKYKDFLNTLSAKYGLTRVADWPLSSLDIRCFVFKPNSQLSEQTLEQVAQETHVETVQALQIYNTLVSAYNDPLVELQQGFEDMGIEQTHRYATGKGVKVAVIDTGVDIKHTDLQKRVPFTKNFVDKSNTRFEQDIHGTAIAGVIASNADNAEGMVGIAPEVDIYALKSCWQESEHNQDAYCNSFTLAKAIDMAILKQVDIINLSLGGPEDRLLERLVKKAIDKNIIVVGAVHPTIATTFPTSVPGVIGVSEKPMTDQQRANKNIFAQGNKVISTTPENKYDFYSGSSISTAHITGIIALIRQREPHLSYKAVHQLLIDHQIEDNPVNACKVFASLIGADRCH